MYLFIPIHTCTYLRRQTIEPSKGVNGSKSKIYFVLITVFVLVDGSQAGADN